MYFIISKNSFKPLKLYSKAVLSRQTVSQFSSATQINTVKKKDSTSESLGPKYDCKKVESIWYDWWEKKNYFKPSKSDSDSFIMILPPPNVTGSLHLGHALAISIQDAIIRWKRMKGESVLWVPGLDHAGIATQVAVEKYLEKTAGSSRHDLGREEFIKKVWEWKQEKGSKICEQLRSTGASLDWSRFQFTMDPVHSERVAKYFIKFFYDGLIYRKKGLVNWSCTLRSSISDIEIKWLNIKKTTDIEVPEYGRPIKFGLMYAIAYKFCDGDGEVVVHTTRPETILGDVAIAIHPNDPNYIKYRNKMVWHPFRHEKLPIIVDTSVDPNFGSGAVKITPSHSLSDYTLGQRHDLPCIDVINDEGLINHVGMYKKFFNLKRYDARDAIIDELQKLGLLRNIYEYSMDLPICSRSGDVIEPMLKYQWFLKSESLAKDAIEMVESGNLKLIPNYYANVWKNWLKNNTDWNLSRQLWWGHRIPMYECTSEGKKTWVGALSLEEAKIKGSEILQVSMDKMEVMQDTDVLDTWFSSALLPLSTLTEPITSLGDKPPISLMMTGHDILFFWVARMVFLTKYITGKVPFNEIVLHALVYDSNGKKMSKSLGNAIKPEDIISGRTLDDMVKELKDNFKQGLIADNSLKDIIHMRTKMFPKGIPECGADTLRFYLCTGNIQSANVNFDLDICRSIYRFCNKIWQATKYLIKFVNEFKASERCNSEIDFENVRLENEDLKTLDKWILSRLASTVQLVEDGLSSYKFSTVTLGIKFFFIEELCSVYLECTKTCATHNISEYKKAVLILYTCIETSLKLLSPFMPFITEHLYQALPEIKGLNKSESITISEFPKPSNWLQFCNVELENKFEGILNLISVLNQVRQLYALVPRQSNVFVKCTDDLSDVIFVELAQSLTMLGKVKSLIRVYYHDGHNVIENVINPDFVVYIEHHLDKETLMKRLNPQIENEKTLKSRLAELTRVSDEDMKNMPPLEKIHFNTTRSTIQDELKKIEGFKKTIENCTK